MIVIFWYARIELIRYPGAGGRWPTNPWPRCIALVPCLRYKDSKISDPASNCILLLTDQRMTWTCNAIEGPLRGCIGLGIWAEIVVGHGQMVNLELCIAHVTFWTTSVRRRNNHGIAPCGILLRMSEATRLVKPTGLPIITYLIVVFTNCNNLFSELRWIRVQWSIQLNCTETPGRH
jgi:hypothetical protein